MVNIIMCKLHKQKFLEYLIILRVWRVPETKTFKNYWLNRFLTRTFKWNKIVYNTKIMFYINFMFYMILVNVVSWNLYFSYADICTCRLGHKMKFNFYCYRGKKWKNNVLGHLLLKSRNCAFLSSQAAQCIHRDWHNNYKMDLLSLNFYFVQINKSYWCCLQNLTQNLTTYH